MTDRELATRRLIFNAFAATGEPPNPAQLDAESLAELERLHVIVLRNGRIHMAHPFAGHHDGARVTAADGRTWWGNCAWDGLGIVAALGLRETAIESGGVTLRVDDGAVLGDAYFHVAVPAEHWWDDIEHT